MCTKQEKRGLTNGDMDSDGADDHRFGRRIVRILGIYPEEIRKKDIKTMMLIGLAHDRLII
jgi:hypothetical protein